MVVRRVVNVLPAPDRTLSGGCPRMDSRSDIEPHPPIRNAGCLLPHREAPAPAPKGGRMKSDISITLTPLERACVVDALEREYEACIDLERDGDALVIRRVLAMLDATPKPAYTEEQHHD